MLIAKPLTSDMVRGFFYGIFSKNPLQKGNSFMRFHYYLKGEE